MIRLDGDYPWQYAAIDLEPNARPHVRLLPTRTKMATELFLTDLERVQDVDHEATILVDGGKPHREVCRSHGRQFRHERRGSPDSA